MCFDRGVMAGGKHDRDEGSRAGSVNPIVQISGGPLVSVHSATHSGTRAVRSGGVFRCPVAQSVNSDGRVASSSSDIPEVAISPDDPYRLCSSSADVPELVRVTRPLPLRRRVSPRDFARLLLLDAPDHSGDHAFFGELADGVLERLAAELHTDVRALRAVWSALRSNGLGMAFQFRSRGFFIACPSGSYLCHESADALSAQLCLSLQQMCVSGGTTVRRQGFSDRSDCSRLRWLWMVQMPCRLRVPDASQLVLEVASFAATVLGKHLLGSRAQLFASSLKLYREKGVGCLSMFVNHFESGPVIGVPLHVDNRNVHGTVVISLTTNDHRDQLMVCVSSAGAGCYYTTSLHVPGHAVAFGPNVFHGLPAIRRTSPRFTVNVFF